MKKLTLALTAAAMVLSTLSAHAGTVETSDDTDTNNTEAQYKECMRLEDLAKKQNLTGQDEITHSYCYLTVQPVKLNIEKNALLKQIMNIDKELSSLSRKDSKRKELHELKDEFLKRIQAIDTELDALKGEEGP